MRNNDSQIYCAAVGGRSMPVVFSVMKHQHWLPERTGPVSGFHSTHVAMPIGTTPLTVMTQTLSVLPRVVVVDQTTSLFDRLEATNQELQ